jgi:hypothetical protein
MEGEMPQVDEEKDRETTALKKLEEAAAELAKLNNSRKITEAESEELTRRAT